MSLGSLATTTYQWLGGCERRLLCIVFYCGRGVKMRSLSTCVHTSYTMRYIHTAAFRMHAADLQFMKDNPNNLRID